MAYRFMSTLTKKQYLLISAAIVVALAAGILGATLPWFIMLGGIAFFLIALLIFKKPFFGILLIAFFLPFERLGAYQFGTTTIRATQILLIITALAWFLRLVIKHRYTFAKNPVLIPLSLFLAASLASIPHSLNIGRSATVFLYIVFTAVQVVVVPNLVIRKEKLKKIMVWLLVSFTIVSVFGLLQFLGDMSGFPPEVTGLRALYTKQVLGFTRVQSTAYEPLYFANYQALVIPVKKC